MEEGEIKILFGGFIDDNEDGGYEKRARKRTALERFLDIFITIFSTVSIRIKKKNLHTYAYPIWENNYIVSCMQI